MKISLLQENLTKGINIASRFVSPRSQLPILQNILLSAKGAKLRISATNLETGISVYLGAKIDEEGEIAVPARVVGEFVAGLPQERAALTAKDSSLKVECGKYRASINGMSGQDFPLSSQTANKPQLVWQEGIFSQAAAQVVFSASQDENRPVLNGVLIILKGKKLRLAATDGYRLSLKELEVEGEKNKEEVRFLVPARALLEAGKITQEKEASGKKEGVGIALLPEGNQAVFFWEDIELTTRLIDGQFPEFEKIIPKDATATTVFDKSEMLQAVKSAAVFARDSSNIIRLKISQSGVEVFANTAQVGENTISVAAENKGEDNEIAFNSRFLLDYLNYSNSERIALETKGPLSPGVFRQEKDLTLTHVIMPVRVQN